MMIVGDMEIRLRADIARLQRDMDSARRVVNDATTSISRAADMAKAALASIGVGAGLAQLIQMSDAYTKFTAQLKLATTSTQEYARAYADVKRIATTAQADLGSTGVLYARIANGTRELGIAQQQVAQITEVVNLALKVSGATAEESGSAMLQLSQSFASGTLRGEEFNAVNEAAPRLMKALADGIGVPVGALKNMATAGLITSSVMADVLPRALEQLRAEATQVQTIGGAFTILKNNIMEFTAQHAEANGTIAVLTGSIKLLANNITLLVGVATTLTAMKLGGWFATMAASGLEAAAAALANYEATQIQRNGILAVTQAQIAEGTTKLALVASIREETVSRLASANANIVAARAAIQASEAAGAQSFALRTLKLSTIELTVAEQARSIALAELAALGRQQAVVTAELAAAQAVQTTGMGLAAGAAGVLRGAMGFLGGPIGLITLAIGVATAAWMYFSDKSDEAARKSAEAARLTESSVTGASTGIRAELDKLILKYGDVLKAQKQSLGAAGFQAESSDIYKKQLGEQQRLAMAFSAMNASGTGTTMMDGQMVDIQSVKKMLGAVTQDLLRRDEALKQGRENGLADLLATSGALTKAEERVKAVKEIKQKFDNAIAGESDDGRIKAAAAARDNAIAALDNKGSGAATGIANSALRLDVENAKRAMQEKIAVFADAEKIMEATRAAGKVSDADYYAATVGFVRLKAEAEIAGLQAENTRMENESSSGKRSIDIQNKIADNESRIAIVRASAAAQVTTLGIQQQAALDKVGKAYREAEAAAQQYLDTTRLGYARDLASVGQGDAEQKRVAGSNQIDDKYSAQLQKLESDRRQGAFDGKELEYQQDIDRIQRFRTQALADWQVYYDQRKAMEADWTVGANQALQNYSDSAHNVAGQVESAFTNAAHGLEDAWVNFVTTGKLSFGSLATSVVADIARMQARAALSGLFNFAVGAVSSYFGSQAYGTTDTAQMVGGAGGFQTTPGGMSGARAGGGPVAANSLYQVNERGPELLNMGGNSYLMMGNSGGSVTSNEDAFPAMPRGSNGGGGDAASNIEVNVYIQQDGNSKVEAPDKFDQFGRELGDFVDARINRANLKSSRQSGAMWNLKNGVS
jgi:lambda family phage tail tape measure protein